MSKNTTTGRGKGRRKDTYKKIPLTIAKKEEAECPSYLKGEAKKEFERLATVLADLNIAGKADQSILAMYCVAFANWREAEEQLTKGKIQQINNGLEARSPWVSIANDYFKQMQSCLIQLGLTPAARKKMIAEAQAKAPNSVLAFASTADRPAV